MSLSQNFSPLTKLRTHPLTPSLCGIQVSFYHWSCTFTLTTASFSIL